MANRFFVNGGVDNNWGTSGNWSTTSGGAGGAAVPTSSDDVFFDGSSPDCTINTSTRNALSLNCTGYTNTLTFNAQLTVAGGNITLAAGMALAGASPLTKATTGTLTSNGLTVTVPLTLTGGVTYTLADAWSVSGLLTVGSVGTTTTCNGQSFQVLSSLTVASSAFIAGTTVFVFAGTGTWTGVSSSSRLANVDINTAGTLTLAANVAIQGTLTYTAGTVVTSGSTLTVQGTSTLNCAGVTWNNVTILISGSTLTFSDDLNVAGTLTMGNAGVQSTLSGNQILLSGSLVVANTSSLVTGTTEIVFTGTGSWSAGSNSRLRVPVTINTAGTFTVSGQVNFSASTLTYTAGTLASASGILNIESGTATVLAFAGATLPFVLQITTAGVIANLSAGLEIGATGGLTLIGTAASPVGIRSNSTPTQRAVTVNPGAQIDIGYCNATDIDSSGGDEVFVFKGTLSNATNWTLLTPYTSPLTLGSGGGGEHSYVF